MVQANQLTIFTDFDNTMVKEHSALWFIVASFLRFRRRTLGGVFSSILQHGFGTKAYLSAVSALSADERKILAQKVVDYLSFNSRWLAQLQVTIHKHPNIRSIRIIVITRNLLLIPQLFMEKWKAYLEKNTDARYTGEYLVIGNELTSDPKVPRSIASQILKSSEKDRFLKTSNAFYFGDPEEHREIAHNPSLRNLKFVRV